MKVLRFLSIFIKLAIPLLLAAAVLIFPQASDRQVQAHDSGHVRIDIEENGFQPASLSIQPGTAVDWRNKTNGPRSAISASATFNSGVIPKGAEYHYTFNTPGTFTYTDQYSPFTGSVTVLGSSGTPPPAPSPNPNPTPAPAPIPTTLGIGDNFFTPTSYSTTVGAMVTWTNNGQKAHSVTSNAGIFNSGVVNPGQSFSFTFQTSGTFSYHCIFHDGQVGSITVTGNSITPQPTPTPVPTPVPTPAPIGPNTIQIADNLYSPVQKSLSAGAIVTWTNVGQRPHTVTSDMGLFDSGMLNPGQSFSFIFQTSGTYFYHCVFHDGQSGTVTVTGNSITPQPTPTPVPTPVPTPAPIGPNTIQVGDNLYSPVQKSLSAGAIVTWTNVGQRPHTVTSDTGLFDSGMLNPGQSFSFTFQTSGTYSYHCVFHDGQTGTITVNNNISAPPTVQTVPPVPNQADASSSEPPVLSSTTAPVGNGIQIGDNVYAPAQLSLITGATVVWTNTGRFPHTVTSNTGLFDSGMLKTGQSFSFTFQSPGTYDYHCVYHSGQDGTIVVSDGGHISASTEQPAQSIPLSNAITQPAETNDQPAALVPTLPEFKFSPGAFAGTTVLAFILGGLVALAVTRRVG